MVVEIRSAEPVRSHLVAHTGFLAVRALRPQVRIGGKAPGRIDCVEIVERGRLERGSGADAKPQLAGQSIGVAEQAGGVAAELAVVVDADIRL